MGNTWIDLPFIDAMDYFSGIIGVAFHWAERYGYLFGLLGLTWSAYKIIFSRMQLKEFWWDTLFKWVGFILLITLYPSITSGFMAIGNEIGMKAGGGEKVIVSGLETLQTNIKKDLEAYEDQLQDASRQFNNELESSFNGLVLDFEFENSKNFDDYLNKVSDKIKISNFSNKDRARAMEMVEDVRSASKLAELAPPYDERTLALLNKILVKKTIKNKDGNIVSSYVSLDIYLRDKNGDKTPYISPSTLMRVTLLCCKLMWQKDDMRFTQAIQAINDRESKKVLGLVDTSKMADKLEAYVARIPQKLVLIFEIIVLIAATIFALIQYLMTILEYTIIVGIGAIFIPLILFDGTKDIPKKLIPVFTSFMVKIIVITICLMFVYWLTLINCVNTIADDGGWDWTGVAEILFNSILIYMLTQNAPKIAQTILTGQPQLSMGEFVAGAGTALGTAAAMKQAPGAVRKAAVKASDKAGQFYAGVQKSNAASAAAKEALGSNATGFQRFAAGAMARGAVASDSLKERMKAKYEADRRTGGTGLSVLDKGLSMAGLSGAGGGAGGSGGSGGGASAYAQTGQWNDKEGNHAMNNYSNPDFKSATKYDDKTEQQRNMNYDEWVTEKVQQGQNVGSSVGEWMKQRIDNANKNKADNPEVAKSDSKGERMS